MLRVHSRLVEDGVRSVSPMMLKRRYRRVAYEAIPNRRYADGALVLLWSVYESAAELGVDPAEIEWRDWLAFQQAEKEYPCKNITLRGDLSFGVSVVGFNGEKGKVELEPTMPKGYGKVLEYILDNRVPYTGRVVLDGYGSRRNTLWVHGELHLTVPYSAYYDATARHRRNSGRLYAGADVNMDRINLTIVDGSGRLRDVRTFWFREVTARGYPRRRAWSTIGMAVHEMLDGFLNIVQAEVATLHEVIVLAGGQTEVQFTSSASAVSFYITGDDVSNGRLLEVMTIMVSRKFTVCPR
jgi:hypothetical protein